MKRGIRFEVVASALARIEAARGPVLVTTGEVIDEIWSDLVDRHDRETITCRAAEGDTIAKIALRLIHGADRHALSKHRASRTINSDRRWAIAQSVLNPVRSLRQLESDGLVERWRDGRAARVRLTEEGRAAVGFAAGS